MAHVEITRLAAEAPCATHRLHCAEGARVLIDGALSFDWIPLATCPDEQHWNECQVYEEILRQLDPELQIIWLSDSAYCETCGTNFADGARVERKGKTILDLTPVASCFGSGHQEDEVFAKLMETLGHSFVVSDERYPPSQG